MTFSDTDISLDELATPFRDLEPSDEQVARVMRVAGRRRHRPGAMLGTAILVLVLGAGAGVPQVRAAVGDVAQAFAGYFRGDGESIGAQAERAESPAWLFADDRTGQVMLADAPGTGDDLFMVVEPSGSIGFGLGDAVAVSDTTAGWTEQFEGHRLQLLGVDDRPSADRTVTLFGVTARSVAAIDVEYEAGPPTAATLGDGGFTVDVEAGRQPRELIARDDAGTVLENAEIGSYYPWESTAESKPAE